MPTKKQIAANRLNAKKSTGPRTNAGKTQAALNSRKHGFAGSAFTVVRIEDLKQVDNLRQDAIDFYQPINSQEIFAVERIALCQMALLRISHLESGMLTECLDMAFFQQDEPIQFTHPDAVGASESTKAQNCNHILAYGFRKNTLKPQVWELFLRYQTQTERQYRRAVEDFNRLVALRPDPELEASPNEPNFAEPRSTQPDPASSPRPAGRTPTPAPDENSPIECLEAPGSTADATRIGGDQG